MGNKRLQRFNQDHLTPAHESVVEAVSHQIGEIWRARNRRSRVNILCGYFGIMQELRADVPVTCRPPRDEATPLPETLTAEHPALGTMPVEAIESAYQTYLDKWRSTIARIRTQPLKDQEVPIHEQKTQPLPAVSPVENVFVSIKPLIHERIPTQPLDVHTVEPALKLKMKRGA